jgi:hypothetical protein
MTTYTVIGLIIHDRLVVAGVIEGAHNCIDSEPGDVDGDGQRYATTVDADSPDEAAHVATLDIDEAPESVLAEIRSAS